MRSVKKINGQIKLSFNILYAFYIIGRAYRFSLEADIVLTFKGINTMFRLLIKCILGFDCSLVI